MVNFISSTTCVDHFLFSTTCVVHFLFSTTCVVHFISSTTCVVGLLISTTCVVGLLISTTCVVDCPRTLIFLLLTTFTNPSVVALFLMAHHIKSPYQWELCRRLFPRLRISCANLFAFLCTFLVESLTQIQGP